MSKDFNDNQGGIESGTAVEFDPIESGVPKSGISEAPKTDVADFGPGPGIGNSRPGIR